MSKQQAYPPTRFSVSDEETQSFLPVPLSSLPHKRNNFWHKHACTLGWLFAFVFLCTNLYSWAYPRQPTDLQCTKQLNAWSPVTAIEYEDVQFSNTFYQPSPYRGPPTPALEKAWQDLWHIGTISVPLTSLPLLNKSATAPWYLASPTSALAGLEAFHSLHCLDLIRQYTYRDSYDYSSNPSFQDDDEFVRVHVDHCIEALRLRLMCYADTTPFLHLKSDGAEAGVTPDFDTQHKCKKFEKVQQWARENHARGMEGQGVHEVPHT